MSAFRRSWGSSVCVCLCIAWPLLAAPALAGPPLSLDADEAGLASAVRLSVVVRLALARNPELLEARARAEVGAARVEAAGRLPDAELKGELWGMPLAAPLSFDRAQTIMLGVRQAFPAAGTRAAQERMAAEEAAAAREMARGRGREVVAQARRAYVEYARAGEEQRVHAEHVSLIGRLLELARVSYQSGHGMQQDVLRLQLEEAELHADVADIEQQRQSARAQLNVLMGRAPDAPLGEPAPEAPAAAAPSGATDAGESAPPRADARPELAAAARLVRREEAALELARRSARWPSLMAGADYWYMPLFPDVHGYGAMLSMSLPWLNPRSGAEVRAAERAVAAERRALEARRSLAAFEARDAAAKLESARRALAILDASVLPQARRTFESTQTAYQAGQGTALAMVEALREYWNVRMLRSRAAARLEVARADHDRAAGAPVPGEEAEAP